MAAGSTPATRWWRGSELAAPPDGPALYLLEKGPHTVVGALLVFRHSGVLSTYKTGWDPAYASFGVGIAMHSAAMHMAWAEGFDTFDFLRGQGAHKYSLGAVDRHDVCLLLPVGLRGTLLSLREAGAERALVAARARLGRPETIRNAGIRRRRC